MRDVHRLAESCRGAIAGGPNRGSLLAMSPRQPFTDWAEVPLVCGIEDTARVLNTSARSLYRRLETGAFVPGVMPRDTSTSPWRFSKKKLQDWVEGGYHEFQRRHRR